MVGGCGGVVGGGEGAGGRAGSGGVWSRQSRSLLLRVRVVGAGAAALICEGAVAGLQGRGVSSVATMQAVAHAGAEATMHT